jgi:hypothetical protein
MSDSERTDAFREFSDSIQAERVAKIRTDAARARVDAVIAAEIAKGEKRAQDSESMNEGQDDG